MTPAYIGRLVVIARESYSKNVTPSTEDAKTPLPQKKEIVSHELVFIITGPTAWGELTNDLVSAFCRLVLEVLDIVEVQVNLFVSVIKSETFCVGNAPVSGISPL